jgi:hypothetical protein
LPAFAMRTMSLRKRLILVAHNSTNSGRAET